MKILSVPKISGRSINQKNNPLCHSAGHGTTVQACSTLESWPSHRLDDSGYGRSLRVRFHEERDVARRN